MTVDTKDINPDGSCCFLVPIKLGAFIIALLSAVYCTVVAFMDLLSLSVFGCLVGIFFAVNHVGGAYCIWNGIYYGIRYYAISGIIFHPIMHVMWIFELLTASCSKLVGTLATLDHCASIRLNRIFCFFVFATIDAYFVYVTYDFSEKMRLSITKSKNTPAQRA